MQSAVRSLQSAVCGLQSAVWSLQSAVCSLRSAVCGLRSANVIHRANHVVNIKNLLEYNPSYVEFYYLDTSRHAERNKYTKRQVTHRRNEANNADQVGLTIDDVEANYNKGFAIRKVLLGDSATVRCEIPLHRYSFFESLEEKLLPNTKIELNIELESNNNLIWRAGGNDCRVILTRFQLFIPRLTINSEGQKLYMENYLKPYKWVYLHEKVERSNNSQQQTGHFRITNAISKPRPPCICFWN